MCQPAPALAEAIPLSSEAVFLDVWDADIKRAARAAAHGDVDEEDLAQIARGRLVVVHRAFPDAPAGYVRTVIGNAIRSANRRKRRTPIGPWSYAIRLQEHKSPSDHATLIIAIGVRRWVSGLPPRLQAIYRLLYSEGRSQREAAKLMGLSQPRIAQLHNQLLERGRLDFASLAA